MEYRWNIKSPSDTQLITELSSQLNNLDSSLTNILIQRGVDSLDKAKKYFRPDINELHSPFLMKDMEEAVERLNQAISKNENILIYGDYDVDGTTSVALVYSYLKSYHSNISYYIPDRYKEGYGISFQSIDFAKDQDISLIIALDCGIKAIDKIAYANERGIDYIICDHHLPGNEIPNAVAVLDPKRSDCEYPYKGLSGCGVGFKFMHAWTLNNNKNIDTLFEYLDLLCISTCADIVPITDENRTLVHFGLERINTTPRLSISTMLNLAGFKKPHLNVMDVVFSIAPRINAAGRIKSGEKAVEMLISEEAELVKDRGNSINELNAERKDLDKSITQEALDMIRADSSFNNRKSTVVFKDNWHKGVIGIVASRLIETHYKPTIVLTESKGKVTGSARTVEGFDVYEAISACSDLLEQYGGHTAAAGLTMKKENVEAFKQKFDQVVSELITPELLTPQLNIDTKLNFSQITDKFNRILKQMSPFGPMNMIPVFYTENVLCSENFRIVGDNHIKITVFQEENPSQKFDCIGFNLGHHIKNIDIGVPVKIAYNIEENTWNGRTTIQLNLKDIQY